MTLVRRRWLLVVFNIIIVTIGSCALLIYSLQRPATAIATPVPAAVDAPSPALTSPDLLTYSRVLTIRRNLALTSVDLAAMGCTRAQASSVLTALRNWCESNKTAWDTAEQQQWSARGSLQEAWRKVNVGPYDAGTVQQIPVLQQAVTSADAQLKQLLDQASTVASAQLPSAQQLAWTAAKANTGLSDVYRYAPNLTADELTLIHSRQESPALAASILDGSQARAIQQAAQNTVTCMPSVAQAEQDVLPVPPQFQMSMPVPPNTSPPAAEPIHPKGLTNHPSDQ